MEKFYDSGTHLLLLLKMHPNQDVKGGKGVSGGERRGERKLDLAAGGGEKEGEGRRAEEKMCPYAPDHKIV